MSEELDKSFIESQKQLLLGIRSEILNRMRNRPLNEIQAVDQDQITEDAEHAQVASEQSISFGLQEKEIIKLREIDAALQRIQEGTYGICEENDVPIERKRLEKVPWARFSIEAAEERERVAVA